MEPSISRRGPRRGELIAPPSDVWLPRLLILPQSDNRLVGGDAGFARALVMEPKILLFDEPDSGLDPVRTALLCDLIKEIQRKYKTPFSGARMPHLERSPMKSLCMTRLSASIAGTGRRHMRMPRCCGAMPPGLSRRTMLGGVRIEIQTWPAPLSTRSVAISAPEFPAPTTSTSRPR